MAEETGRPYGELLREQVMETEAFWKTYDGDRSLSGILRSRFQRPAVAPRTQVGTRMAADNVS